MIDRTTKVLLVVIALGLWANAVIPLFQPKTAAAAQDVASMDSHLASIDSHLSRIDHDVHNLADIEDGTCRNGKIC